MPRKQDPLWPLMGLLFKAHPWHGVPAGDDAPEIVNSYIEIVPSDTVKYELDKQSGFLWVDRPQKFSNICPALYGLIPKTYCGPRVAELGREQGVSHGATRLISACSRNAPSRMVTSSCGRGPSAGCR